MFGKMVTGRMPNLTHRCNFAGGGEILWRGGLSTNSALPALSPPFCNLRPCPSTSSNSAAYGRHWA